MESTPNATLLTSGLTALRSGDFVTARRHFEAMSPPSWLPLAQACNRMGDSEGEEAALKGQLAADARNLPALLAMAVLKERTQDHRAATSFYRTAIAQASVMEVPAALHPLLDRGQAFLMEANAAFESHLRNSLSAAGLAQKSARIAQSIDLLTGKATLYQQQPSMFYFPGLPQRQFYERGEFDWLAEVEAATTDMQSELRDVLADGQDFRPYVETAPDRPAPNNPLRDDPAWGAHYFWKNGAQVTENTARAPATMTALASAPLPHITGRSPMALWSLLKPGTHIAPHYGMLNTRLICHIPLIVPPDCALRVGNETRSWEPGKALIFDDSIEHEAWNRSADTRVILLFEIWRPEITEEERAALVHLFEAIDAYGPQDAESGGPL